MTQFSFGAAIPNAREGGAFEPGRGFGTVPAIENLALKAEQVGFDTLWLDDHLAEHPAHDGQPQAGILESVAMSAFLASITSHVRIGTGIIILPLREPVLLARQYATLDHISGGRAILGVGVGVREELESVRPAESKMHRWETTVSRALSIRALLNEGEGSASSEYTTFGPLTFNPPPVQRPFPIHVATHLAKNLGTVASFAQGWHIAGKTPSEVQELTEVLDSEIASRGVSPLERIGHFSVRFAADIERAIEAGQAHSPWMRKRWKADHPGYLLGTPDNVADKLTSYVESGVTGACFIFLAADPDDSVEQLQTFAQEVIPRINSQDG